MHAYSPGEGHCCQYVFAYSVLSVMSVQSFCGKDEGFCGKDEGFLAKMKDFLLFLHLCQNSFIFATLFSMFTLHTNEGSTYTELVQTY